jgi:hypothetical protein
MPATYSAEHFTARERNLYVEFDVTTTDSTVADLGQAFGSTDNLLDLSQYGGLQKFYVALFKTVGTGNTDEFSIIAATNAAGTGSPTVVIQTATATAQTQNAVGDFLVLECDIDMIREVLPTATHVGVRLEPATNTDEWVIHAKATYLHSFTGLSANFIQ